MKLILIQAREFAEKIEEKYTQIEERNSKYRTVTSRLPQKKKDRIEE